LYRRTDRESLRTPDGIPLIKDGGKSISNVDTLMEIQPGIFVDYMGCIKQQNTEKNPLVLCLLRIPINGVLALERKFKEM